MINAIHNTSSVHTTNNNKHQHMVMHRGMVTLPSSTHTHTHSEQSRWWFNFITSWVLRFWWHNLQHSMFKHRTAWYYQHWCCCDIVHLCVVRQRVCRHGWAVSVYESVMEMCSECNEYWWLLSCECCLRNSDGCSVGHLHRCCTVSPSSTHTTQQRHVNTHSMLSAFNITHKHNDTWRMRWAKNWLPAWFAHGTRNNAWKALLCNSAHRRIFTSDDGHLWKLSWMLRRFEINVSDNFSILAAYVSTTSAHRLIGYIGYSGYYALCVNNCPGCFGDLKLMHRIIFRRVWKISEDLPRIGSSDISDISHFLWKMPFQVPWRWQMV